MSGEHTRTIQIATPTVGGLMKFAVKTVTCLGCKTPLRANNSVSSAYRLRRSYNTKSSLCFLIDGAVCDNCRPRINELYQKQVQSSFLTVFPINLCTAGNDDLRDAGEICKTMDAVSAMPRISTSGMTKQSGSKGQMIYRHTLGCAVH